MNKNDLRVNSIPCVDTSFKHPNNKEKENDNNQNQNNNKNNFIYQDLKRVVKKHVKESETNIMELKFAAFLVKDGFTIKEASIIAEVDINEITNYIYKTLKRENKDEYNYLMEILREREYVKQKRK